MALGLAQLLSAKGGVTFTTTGHTAVDVPACATGPDAGLFVGVQENTPDVARDVTELAFWRGHLTGTGGDRGGILPSISRLPEHRTALQELRASPAAFSPIALPASTTQTSWLCPPAKPGVLSANGALEGGHRGLAGAVTWRLVAAVGADGTRCRSLAGSFSPGCSRKPRRAAHHQARDPPTAPNGWHPAARP
jgi:hypothetical protein